MVSRCMTIAFQGIDAVPVDVQVMIGPGKHGINLVGLADKAVAESRERVHAALHACGLALPAKKITVNLAPADLPKEGSHYDLPIALAMMSAMGAIPSDSLDRYIVIGELALDGKIAPILGALPAAIGANALDKGLICPLANGPEAVWAGDDIDILAPSSLIALVNHFKGTQVLSRPRTLMDDTLTHLGDMAEIRGQETARRALEIAAAGGHNLLLIGPPGSGKSMLASRLPSILPPLTPEELLEVSMIHSIAGLLADGKLSTSRPYRAPHHSASMAALVGGGSNAKPGEASLSHNGVLFLDELPEFSPQVLNSLRQPLELGETVIARANTRVSYPSRFQLVAAMNPCKCGMLGSPGHQCHRGVRCSRDYQSRVSGPLLDRIDLRIECPAVSTTDLITPVSGESSSTVAARVAQARSIQYDRYTSLSSDDASVPLINSGVSNSIIESAVGFDSSGKDLLVDASQKMHLSARGFHRVLKVARTIADLAGSDTVTDGHLSEAISYRIAGQYLSHAA